MLLKKIIVCENMQTIVCLIIHIALIRITIQNPEEMPTVFEL